MQQLFNAAEPLCVLILWFTLYGFNHQCLVRKVRLQTRSTSKASPFDTITELKGDFTRVDPKM